MVWQSKTLNDKAKTEVERRCLPRSDGRWDYYPGAFAEPGYVIDDSMKGRLVEARTRLRNMLFFPAITALIAFGFYGYGVVAALVPSLDEFAASGIVRWNLAGLLFIALFVLMVRLQLSRSRRILATAEPVTRTIPKDEGKRMTLPQRKTVVVAKAILYCALLLCFIGLWVFAWFGVKRVQVPDPVSRVEGAMMLSWPFMIVVFGCARGFVVAKKRAKRARENTT